MTHPRERKMGSVTDSRKLMVKALALSLLILAVMLHDRDASAEGKAAMITSTGSITTADGAIVPPFPKPGRWMELEGKSSERWESRHFMYMVPNGPPAIELYLSRDRHDEAPDGAFETGLAKGFVRGFASKAGFSHQEPTFEERNVGTARAQHASVQLSKGGKLLWIHAYIYLRKPSLTFIAVTGEDGAQEGIEKYLARVQMK